MQIKDLAICLRTVNYSETSQVVTLLTREYGKIALMAKGSRRVKSSFDSRSTGMHAIASDQRA